MSETQSQEQESQDAPITVEGDAVVNNAPDGGGVDNNVAESTDGDTDGDTGGDKDAS